MDLEIYKEKYKFLLNIHHNKFYDKSVLLIGSGRMAEAYCHSLRSYGISKVVLLGNRKEKVEIVARQFGFKGLDGGYEKHLDLLGDFSLIIIALPIELLFNAGVKLLQKGYKNILIEKPGALYPKELLFLAKMAEQNKARVRIAYNRVVYPSLWKAKELVEFDGGITSCVYSFTEWTHRVKLSDYSDQVKRRWGLANPLHVISMVHYLIGYPKDISCFQKGYLEWHTAGDRFFGSGLSEKDIPFSYYADWNSAGRWGVKFMTSSQAIKLIPLEDLYSCKKGSIQWEKIEIIPAFPNLKTGVAEEVAIMLDHKMEEYFPLIDLEEGSHLLSLGEKIFGYN